MLASKKCIDLIICLSDNLNFKKNFKFKLQDVRKVSMMHEKDRLVDVVKFEAFQAFYFKDDCEIVVARCDPVELRACKLSV